VYKDLNGPLAVQLEFSEGCTHRCFHCYNYWRESCEGSGKNLSWDDAKRIIDQLIKEKVFRLVATGGEPFLNKEVLFKALEALNSAGITMVINSNLVLLTDQDALTIKKLGVSSVLTSLTAPNGSVHDDIVQCRGAFNKTVRGISLLKDVGVSVGVNMVVSKKNNHLIKETADFVKSLGLKGFYATKAGCPGNCHDFSDLRLNPQEFTQYLEDLSSVEKKDFSVGVLEGYPLCGIKDLERYRFATDRRCLAGVTSLTISVNGEIRPCPHLDVTCGNIQHRDLSDIWKDMREWRGKDFLSDVCKKCELLTKCGGGCKMEAKMAGGIDPYICLDNIKHASDQYQGLKVDSISLPLPQLFRLNPSLKWRPEPFGSVIFANGKKLCYFDLDATRMLERLVFNREYCLEELEYEYGSGIESFLTKLYAKNFWVDVND
jgi:radical SAM protein with 4Fe4S-binding SPASM domain